ASFFTPVIASRLSNQRLLAAVIGLCSLFGFAGLLIGNSTVLLYACLLLLGVSQGAAISLALTFIVIRAQDVRQAARLSGMAQSIGYLLAAVGPIVVGLVYDWQQSWTLPLTILCFVSLFVILSGIGAGRNQTV
ncbi:MFS transporter, partial [Mesorhizobium sp. M00.F.Ca.ET.186.01.1.1]